MKIILQINKKKSKIDKVYHYKLFVEQMIYSQILSIFIKIILKITF